MDGEKSEALENIPHKPNGFGTRVPLPAKKSIGLGSDHPSPEKNAMNRWFLTGCACSTQGIQGAAATNLRWCRPRGSSWTVKNIDRTKFLVVIGIDWDI